MSQPATRSGHPGRGADLFEEDLNLYLDAELPIDRQPALFAHLAGSETSRQQFGAVLQFRSWSRQERIQIPAAVDEAFLQRLAERRRLKSRVDRARDRRTLWERERPFSVRAAATALVVVFLLGAVWQARSKASGSDLPITQQVERVNLEDAPSLVPHYVIFPGLTVTDDPRTPLMDRPEH